jgi:DNA-binding LytR/AlgR family response regulator
MELLETAAGQKRCLTVSVELESEVLRSRIVTMLATVDDVFLVAGWTTSHLTALPATLDIVVVEARRVEPTVRRRGKSTLVFAVATDAEASRHAENAGAVEVLTLPLCPTALRAALDRVRARLSGRPRQVYAATPLAACGPVEDDGGSKQTLQIADVDPDTIRWLEAMHAGSRWHTIHGIIESRDSLEAAGKRFALHHLVRVHRSSIVNLRFVRRVIRSAGRSHELVLDDNTRIPMSRVHVIPVCEQLSRGHDTSSRP